MPKIILTIALLLGALGSEAFAQQPRSGTRQEQEACSRDVQRYCRRLLNQGDFVILACLQQNRAKLTSACGQVLVSHGQ